MKPALVLLLDTAVGALAAAAGGVEVLGRRVSPLATPAARAVLHPPLLAPRYHPGRWLDGITRRGLEHRLAARRDLDRLLDVLVPAVMTEVLPRLDLTATVTNYVDIDAIAAKLDVDAAAARLDVDAVARRLDIDATAARLDIDAVIQRIDLVGLAEEIIAAIDLPEIIRQSTGSVASETVRGVRMRGIAGDEALARVVQRRLLRRARRSTPALEDDGETGQPGPDGLFAPRPPRAT